MACDLKAGLKMVVSTARGHTAIRLSLHLLRLSSSCKPNTVGNNTAGHTTAGNNTAGKNTAGNDAAGDDTAGGQATKLAGEEVWGQSCQVTLQLA